MTPLRLAQRSLVDDGLPAAGSVVRVAVDRAASLHLALGRAVAGLADGHRRRVRCTADERRPTLAELTRLAYDHAAAAAAYAAALDRVVAVTPEREPGRRHRESFIKGLGNHATTRELGIERAFSRA